MLQGGACAATVTPTPTTMRLTRFTDNALRCLIYLGAQPEGTPTLREVAERMAMSEDHLLKVVQRLVQLGYVKSIRGRHGGIQLARPAESINVAALVRATEDNLALVPCFEPGDSTCPIAPACTLAGVLDDALGAFFATLEKSTLADLVKPRRRLITLMSATTHHKVPV